MTLALPEHAELTEQFEHTLTHTRGLLCKRRVVIHSTPRCQGVCHSQAEIQDHLQHVALVLPLLHTPPLRPFDATEPLSPTHFTSLEVRIL